MCVIITYGFTFGKIEVHERVLRGHFTSCDFTNSNEIVAIVFQW